MYTQDQKEQFHHIIDDSRHIVFFGGAGVSTASGIPDFRSANGLYSQQYGALRPEDIISAGFFRSNPQLFYQFYKEKMLYPDASPNTVHRVLAKWEKEGILDSVVTQNIDGLHQAAGSHRVYELHGSVLRNYCVRCRRFYDLSYILSSDGVPKCDCGGIVKPDVVLYNENLDEDVIEAACEAIARADTMIVAGTSLNVYPAASYVSLFRGKHLVLINLEHVAVPYGVSVELEINHDMNEVFADYLSE